MGPNYSSRLGRDESLTLHTRFRPIHLLDELERRGFDTDCEELGPQDWKTVVWRIPE